MWRSVMALLTFYEIISSDVDPSIKALLGKFRAGPFLFLVSPGAFPHRKTCICDIGLR